MKHRKLTRKKWRWPGTEYMRILPLDASPLFCRSITMQLCHKGNMVVFLAF